MPTTVNIVGQKFARVFVLWDAGYFRWGKRRERQSLCRCDCGTSFITLNCNLRHGRTKSCGCLSSDITVARNFLHGQTGTGAHSSWLCMIRRCTDKKHPRYKDWGGRGTKIYPQWMVFENFFVYMGPRPPGMSLERIDNNGNYEPGNVCWKLRKYEARNRRSSRIETVNGVTACLSELCELFKKNYGSIKTRLARGWSVELAFSVPFNPPKGVRKSHV